MFLCLKSSIFYISCLLISLHKFHSYYISLFFACKVLFLVGLSRIETLKMPKNTPEHHRQTFAWCYKYEIWKIN